MIFTLEKKEIEEITTTNILPQSPFWGRVKSEQGFIPKAFELTVSKNLLVDAAPNLEKENDDLLILIKYLDANNCYAYVPYGPKLEPAFENQGLFLENLSEAIKSYLPKNCMFIRYDLMWKNQWSEDEEYFDQNGNWNGAPRSKIQEYRINFKTSTWNLKKSMVDVLPKNTLFLDLTLSEQDILHKMRYNTKSGIHKANKSGVKIKEYNMEYISDWYKLYLETAIRHNMPAKNEEYFATILKNQDNSKNGVTIKMLMADFEGEFLSSMFLVLSKTRGTYLYGASSLHHKKLMANYGLQWEAIKIAKQWGCTEYDMFGSAPNYNQGHPLHGVHVFKKGFGGRLFHRMGCWDYPYNSKLYDLFRLKEVNN